MSLTKIDEKGNKYPVLTSPSFENSYDKYQRDISREEQARVKTYIHEILSDKTKFSLATDFGDPWPDELSSLYKFCKDEKLAAFLLASIVIDVLIESRKDWLCIKTNIQDREFASNFYWLENS